MSLKSFFRAIQFQSTASHIKQQNIKILCFSFERIISNPHTIAFLTLSHFSASDAESYI